MRILKKSLALLIALTMMASLVVVSATESTEKVEISLGEASVLTLTSDQENIAIPVYVQNTELTTFCALSATFSVSDSDAVEYTGFDLTKQQIDGVPEQYCPYVLQDATLTTNADNILIDALNDFAAMPEKTQIGTAKFTVAANADPGEYEINFTVAVGGLTNYSMQDVEYNVTAGKITVIEEQWISSIGAEDFGEIEYGVPAPNFPATVKGEGVTSRGKVIAATDDPGVVLDVDWADIDTFVEPTEDLSVVGTITTAETDLLKYKDASGEAIDAPDATATYDIVKSTVGVVAPVEIEVEARLGGTEADVAAIVALDEIKAVADTTIAIEGGETETVTLNWEGATLAEPADATLNLGTAGDSIVLNVPLAGTATYYDLEDKIAAVTITVAEAVKMYNEIEAVTVETEVEYGATEGPALPGKVKGSGKTVGGQEFDTEYSDEFDVEWDDVDTLVAPGNYTVNGTVDEPADDLISFKNTDYTADVDALTATANYKIAKSKAGVVAPVAAIEVAEKDAGTEADVAAIIALEEVLAVTETTITLDGVEGAAEETVTLNWAAATPASEEDTTLNLGSDEDSIVLNVPVTAENTTYYDLDGKFIAVTIQMIPAWKYGDMTGDGLITTADLTALRRYLVADTPEIFIEQAANVYNPETTGITTADLTALRKYLVSEITEFPVVE